MFFSNQSGRHTQLAHKVVREPGYESEPTDWENLFVNMTTHQMNRLENIRKEKNTHTHTHTHTRNLERKCHGRYKTEVVCLTIIQPSHLKMGCESSWMHRVI